MHFDFATLRAGKRGAARLGFATIAMLIGVAIPAAAQTASTKPDDGKRICRSDIPTGTLMTKKTCRTKAQWAAIDHDAEQAFLNRRTLNTVDRSQGGAAVGEDSFGQK